MKQELDKELKALLRGRAIDTSLFKWDANENTGVEFNIAHEVLYLDPNYIYIDNVLETCQSVLIAWGFKTDNLFSYFSMASPINSVNFDASIFIENSVSNLENEPKVKELVLRAGMLPRFKQAKDNRERFAIILKSLIN